MVRGSADRLLGTLDRWMQGEEWLRVVRQRADRIIWEPRRGFLGSVRQLLRGRDYALYRANDIAATIAYLEQKENVLLVGEVGTGKTHIATALAVAACRQGYRVRFFTAAGLTNELLEAQGAHRLGRFESQLLLVELALRSTQLDPAYERGLFRQISQNLVFHPAQDEGRNPLAQQRKPRGIAFALDRVAESRAKLFDLAQETRHQKVEQRPQFAQVILDGGR